jgi:uncharacterized protein (TIGR03435 family)
MKSLRAALAAVFLLTQAHPEFEVASIKPNNSGIPRVFTNPFAFLPGGRFTATNVTLVDLIVRAHGTRRIQMRGGPNWIDVDRFDIVAKGDMVPGRPLQQQLIEMLQTLLADRFKLMLHTETKEDTVYALVVGKDPPKLAAPQPGAVPSFTAGERGRMTFQNTPIIGLVNTLANILHTPVVDGTGITGSFNFTLDPSQFAVTDANGTPVPNAANNFGDLVVTAVTEQLGFNLEKRKASLEITVIDHAEKPTEN